jgi:hypothetical protein
MSPLQLFVVAIVAMVGLATLRVVRVRLGRTPLPAGRGRRLFLLGFVVVPPIAVALLTQPSTDTSTVGAVTTLPIYILLLAAVVLLMAILALIVGRLTHSPAGRLARLALTGVEDDPDYMPSNPPLTARLEEILAAVKTANAAFPRGVDFPKQIDRTDFRADWDALDGATRMLEGQIADDLRNLRGVAAVATDRAEDARGRLDTLRSLAVDGGQAWAAA